MKSIKFKVGDIFKYIGYGIKEDIEHYQVITYIDVDYYYSTFLGDNRTNEFERGSPYHKECVLVEDSIDNIKFDNGIPLVWEDII